MSEEYTHEYPAPPTPEYIEAQGRAREWLKNLDPMRFDGHYKDLMYDAYIAGWLAGRSAADTEGGK